MKALLAGFGGIGANVYYPELKKIGYDVDVLDANVPDVTYTDVKQIGKAYDLAVVCTPNFTHEDISVTLANKGTKQIFVDKPGVKSTKKWNRMRYEHPNTSFHLVKNNLYRENYGELQTFGDFWEFKGQQVIGIDIHWLNANRIPSPGSWFTDKELAFGGVSRDLMPHLYCFAYKLLGQEITMIDFEQKSMQRWSLKEIDSTNYGVVNKKGIYNVDDYALAVAYIDGLMLRLVASWKEGYDKQSITLFLRDGSTYEWNFGLCPSEAYGAMLQDLSDSTLVDMDIHRFLENFDEDTPFLHNW